MNNFKSKYPKVIVDNINNSVNEGLKKIVTIEEWYDLTHHTHDISTLSSDEGGTSYDELVAMVVELQAAIKEIKAEIANMASVKDWDLDTPGIQDSNGNTTLGTLMGFDMTEIE